MRTLWQVIALLAVVHILAGAAVVAWLGGTERLNRQRIVAVAETFKLTIPEEQQEKQKLQQADEAAMKQAERIAALSGAGSGPETVAQKLEQERQKHEITMRNLERTREELEALRRNIQLAQQKLEQERKETAAAKAALEQQVAAMQKQAGDAGFKKAVSMYESLPAKQVKEMFLQMLASGKVEEVASYLEAMQPRKAGGVLKEFKTPEETARAVELTQRLRERGSALTKALETSG